MPERPSNRQEPALELEEEHDMAWIVELESWHEERLPKLVRELSRYEGAKGETADPGGGSTSRSVAPRPRTQPMAIEGEVAVPGILPMIGTIE
ncbi:hypothetical protein ACH35V_23515 [Actinomadura sp. 1N219]|uniref:hypothetical protein n=1 Tax=Actinomadura sp. 1N219 TaxID=3375152 RepID=UPI0037926702